MSQIFRIVLCILLVACSSEPIGLSSSDLSRRDDVVDRRGQRANRRAFSSFGSAAVPLSGTWLAAFDADDLYLTDGAPFSGVWKAREGGFECSFVSGTAPVFRASAYPGGHKALDFVAADAQLRCDALAAYQNGDDLPITFVADIAPTAFNVAIGSFTTSGAAPYHLFHVNATGYPSIVRVSGTTGTSTQPRYVTLGGRNMVTGVFTGTTGQCSTDLLQKASPDSLNVSSLAGVNRFTIGRGREAAPINYQGMIRRLYLKLGTLTQGDLTLIYRTWYGTPRPIGQFGDSLARGEISTDKQGLRYPLWKHIAENDLPYELVGTLDHGTWAHTMHQGNGGNTIQATINEIDANYGPGKQFPSLYLSLLRIGTNDAFDLAHYDGAAAASRLATAIQRLRDISTYVSVANLATVDPALFPAEAANIADFNSRIPAVIAASDTSNPGKAPLMFEDHDAAMGPFNAANYNADGTHWNDAGYARVWPERRDTISGVLVR